MLTSSKPGAHFSRGCAHPAAQPPISTTHPPQFANRSHECQTQQGRMGQVIRRLPHAPDPVCEALRHQLLYVVVVAVLDARAHPSRPRGPQAVADPALTEGSHAGK